MHAVLQVLHGALWVFIALMWIRFVVDWVQIFARSWSPTGFLLVVLEIVYSITDPPIKALRRVIPPLRIGAIAIDLSFIIVMIAAYLLLSIVGSLVPDSHAASGAPAVAAPVTPVPVQALQFRGTSLRSPRTQSADDTHDDDELEDDE